MGIDKKYGVGLILVIFGSAFLAETITSSSGSCLLSAFIIGVGFVLILDSYIGHKKKRR